MTIRIAYFIMVHHKPAEFEWLLEAIYDPNDLFLIHVDRKSRLGIKRDRRGLMAEVKRVCAGRPNVILMRSRFTNWGGWSLSRTLLAAIQEALNRDRCWTHFINLSGQCYPLKPMARIRTELAASSDRLHVELRPLETLPIGDWHLGDNRMIETPLRAFRLRGRLAPPTAFAITHKGSQWVVLPRYFCDWLTKAPLTRSITAYMRRMLLTDELVIQALVTNGPFINKVAGHYRRLILWPGPKVLATTDLPEHTDSTPWFGRKFDLTSGSATLQELARANDFSTPRTVA